jgi:lambda family phage tail tape measure protein
MANIASLGVKLGIDTADFTQGIEKAKEALQNFKERAGELLSVAAFAEMANKAMEYADSVVKTAKANDVAVASVLNLSSALMKNGGDAEETSRIYSGFTQKIESAALGSGKTQEAFARLGVSLKDLKTLSEEDLFNKTVQGLAKMNDSAERNGLAFQVLGRGIKGVDIKGLAADLEEGRGEMDKYAQAVTQAHELSIKLKEASHQLTLEFTNAVFPSLLQLYDALHKDATAVQFFGQVLQTTAETVSVVFKYTATVIVGFFTEIQGVIAATTDAIHGDFTKALQDLKDYDDKVKKMAESDEEFAQKILDRSKQTQKVERPDEEINRKITPAGAEQLLKAQDLSKEYARQAALQFQLLSAKEAETHLTKNQKDYVAEITKVLAEMQKALDTVDKKIATTDPTTAAGQRTIAMLKTQKQQIIDTAQVYVQKTEEEVLATQALQLTFGYGWQKAFDQYVENSNNAAMQAQEMFASITNSMTNALDKFVETGKLNFGDLTKSILNDMLKIELRAQEMKLFQAIGSGIGGLFGGSDVSSISTADWMSGSFASGGNPTVGEAAIVGENGPELFVPQTAGTVVPNNKLADVMGGSNQPTTVYNGPYINNMSAIDTQSATQFLARNQNAVWAANQSAQRSLPQSR